MVAQGLPVAQVSPMSLSLRASAARLLSSSGVSPRRFHLWDRRVRFALGCLAVSSQQAVKRVIEVDDAPGDGTGVLVVGDFHRGEYARLVARYPRVIQIVHHSDEGAAQVFVGNVLRPNGDKMDCRIAQAILHRAGAGGERVDRLHQLLKDILVGCHAGPAFRPNYAAPNVRGPAIGTEERRGGAARCRAAPRL